MISAGTLGIDKGSAIGAASAIAGLKSSAARTTANMIFIVRIESLHCRLGTTGDALADAQALLPGLYSSVPGGVLKKYLAAANVRRHITRLDDDSGGRWRDSPQQKSFCTEARAMLSQFFTGEPRINLLIVFAIGYAGILLTPGPSLFLTASLVGLHGRAIALPLCIGLALGAMSLVTLCLFASHAAIVLTHEDDFVRRLVAAATLAATGVSILRLKAPGTAELRRGPIFALGYVTALTNPVTGSYFVGFALTRAQAAPLVDLIAIAALAPLIGFLVMRAWAEFFACRPARVALLRAFRPIKWAVGCAFCVLGVATAAPLLGTFG
jgi:threonine/homoserine/homoserine lactone efflux protein